MSKACRVRQLELDRSPGLLLPDARTIDRIAIRSDIFDPQGNDVATTQLAVDRRSRVRIAQTWFGRNGGLAPISLPLFQGLLRATVARLSLSGMFVLLGF
jgi:hypothetical protein